MNAITTKLIELAEIVIDAGTQIRAAIDGRRSDYDCQGDIQIVRTHRPRGQSAQGFRSMNYAPTTMLKTNTNLPRRDWRTDQERALVEYSYMANYRAEARQKMKLMLVVLTCLALIFGGLIYHYWMH